VASLLDAKVVEFFKKMYRSLEMYCELKKHIYIYIHEGWNFNSGNYLFTTDTK